VPDEPSDIDQATLRWEAARDRVLAKGVVYVQVVTSETLHRIAAENRAELSRENVADALGVPEAMLGDPPSAARDADRTSLVDALVDALRYCDTCTAWGVGCSAHHGQWARPLPEDTEKAEGDAAEPVCGDLCPVCGECRECAEHDAGCTPQTDPWACVYCGAEDGKHPADCPVRTGHRKPELPPPGALVYWDTSKAQPGRVLWTGDTDPEPDMDTMPKWGPAPHYDPATLPTLDGEPLWPGVHDGCQQAGEHTHTPRGAVRVQRQGTLDGKPVTFSVYTKPQGTERRGCSLCPFATGCTGNCPYGQQLSTPAGQGVLTAQGGAVTVERGMLGHPVCSAALKAKGMAYPRTCSVCRLGPCTQVAPLSTVQQQGGGVPEQGGTPAQGGGVGRCPLTGGTCPTEQDLQRTAHRMLGSAGVYQHQVPGPLLGVLEAWVRTLHSTLHTDAQVQAIINSSEDSTHA